MIVNRDYKHAALAKLRIPHSSKVEQFDRENASWRIVSLHPGENFEIAIDAGDGELLRY